ncbi:MAG: hypothetical protein LC770_04670 [Acidobacteria bacterium]|nr:hypothetical protein [Acidobacteriota bacterium]
MKIHGSWGKHFGPVLLVAVLALFFSATLVNGQTLQDLPPPPPPPKPKPTPTPTPIFGLKNKGASSTLPS